MSSFFICIWAYKVDKTTRFALSHCPLANGKTFFIFAIAKKGPLPFTCPRAAMVFLTL